MSEQTIDQLNIEINQKAGKNVGELDKLADSIQRLKSSVGAGVDKLSGISASLNKLSSSIADLKSKSGVLSSIANSINKLNEAKTDRISGNIKTLTGSLKTLGGMDPSLKTIISDLASLTKQGSGNTAMSTLKLQAQAAKTQATIDKSALTSAKAQQGLQAIAEKNRQIEETARAAAIEEQELGDSIDRAIQQHVAQYGSAGAFSNKATDLGAVMPDYGADTVSWPKSAPSEINANSINELKKSIEGVGSTASAAMNEVSSGSSKATGFVNRLKQSVSSAKEKMSQLGNSSNRFFSLGRFYGWYFILRQIGNIFSGWISNINSYIENMNLFDVAMGKSAESGEKLANSLQSALSIDAGEAMRYMGVFQQMTTSFGVANKQATTMSENLTQLGYDIASFYNISTTSAFEKLESGLSGQSRALRELGIDISSARLQQELYNLGIKEKVNNLSQADKAELRYIAIMKQTMNAQGDMARTIQTPANALRVLQAQLSITGRAIGSIFIPALEAIVPPVTAVIEVIGELASELASLLGFKMPKIDYSSLNTGLSGLSDNADSASNSLGSVGDSANNTGKKLKDTKKDLDNLISGFDELHIIQKDNSSTGTGSSGSGSGNSGNILGGVDLPSYNALKDAISNNIDAIREKLEQYKPLIKEILKTVLEIGAAFLTWKLTSGLFNGLMNLIPPLKAYKGQFAEIAAGLTLVAGLFAFAYLHSENFRRGLSVLGEAIKWVGSKISEFATSAAKSLGIKELSGEFWTSTAAVVVIAIGAVAIALGAPIFGTIAVVGGAAVLAIQAIGYAASDSIPKVNLFGDGISSATEKKVKPFIQEMNTLDETIKGIKWSGRIVTASDVSNIKSQVKTIADTIIDGLDSDKNAALKKLDPLKGVLNSKTYDEIIKANQKHYDTMEKNVTDGESEINKIIQKAKDEHRGLKQSEYDEITKIESNMKTTGIKYLSDSETESNLILQRLKDNHTALSAREASEIVKNSAKQRDTTISDAKKQYEGIMTEAQRMLDVGAINKGQYDEIKDAAEKTKDKTINSAKEQHSKIVEEAKKQSGDLSDQVDWSTGNIKSKWQVFRENAKQTWDGWWSALWKDLNQYKIDFSKWWDSISKSAQDKWNGINSFFKKAIPDWWNKTVAPWFTKAKWTALYDTIKTSLSSKWNEVVTWWNKTAIVNWWNKDVSPWFTAKKWEDMMDGVKTGFKNTFKNAVNAGIGLFNKFIGWINDKMKFTWNPIVIAGKKLADGGSIQLFTIPKITPLSKGTAAYKPMFAEIAEYPDASNNPEVVAPQSIIRETVEESNEGAVTVLAKILEVAEKIAEKEPTIELDGEKVTKNVNKRNANKGFNLGLQST